MAGDGVDQFFVPALFLQDLGFFFAVFFRILFVIQVVEQAPHAPEVLLVPVAQFPGKIPQAAFHRQSMLQMERFLIIFFQQFPSFFSRIRHTCLSFRVILHSIAQQSEIRETE
jgi:hypothetical protein